jgi:toxin-antitoxin system PIN domain toxin
MNMVDVNILIYAHREDQKHHTFYRDKLEELLNSHIPFGMTPLVAAGFVRIVTQNKFPKGPTPLSAALSAIDGFMERPNVHWIMPGQNQWELLCALSRKNNCTGKMISDAQHAAIAIEHGCDWYSCDNDFFRFESEGLRFHHCTPPLES